MPIAIWNLTGIAEDFMQRRQRRRNTAAAKRARASTLSRDGLAALRVRAPKPASVAHRPIQSQHAGHAGARPGNDVSRGTAGQPQ